jgi:hypothetical protein
MRQIIKDDIIHVNLNQQRVIALLEQKKVFCQSITFKNP